MRVSLPAKTGQIQKNSNQFPHCWINYISIYPHCKKRQAKYRKRTLILTKLESSNMICLCKSFLLNKKSCNMISQSENMEFHTRIQKWKKKQKKVNCLVELLQPYTAQ